MIDLISIFSAAAAGLGSPADIWQAILTDFSKIGTPEAMAAFGQVILIDLVFAADNAIVVGALAGGLPAEQRRKVILIGIGGDEHSGVKSGKTFWAAAWAVMAADVSMSLDNVLGVAGAAREHPGILVIGLVLSVALMGLAANVIAKYIERYKWIAYLGLAVIVYVAGKMIYSGLMGDEQTIGVLTLFG